VGSFLIATAFPFFTYFCPWEFPLPKYYRLFFLPFIIFCVWLAIDPGIIIKDLILVNNVFQVDYHVWGEAIYGFFFLLLMGTGFYYLISRYLSIDGPMKQSVRLILFGFSVGGIFGIIFDLLLPFGNIWYLIWLGPYFSLVMIFCVAYLIFRK
jgi:hypothetical protein